MSFEIRNAERSDARGVAEAWVGSWQAAYKDLLTPEQIATRPVEEREKHWDHEFDHPSNGRSVRLVSIDDEGISGFVISGPIQEEGAAEDHAEVRALYLLERAWGTGAGRALLDGALAGLKDLGFSEAILWVLEGNERARRFYETAGWTFDGGTKDCFGGVDAPAVRYRKRL